MITNFSFLFPLVQLVFTPCIFINIQQYSFKPSPLLYIIKITYSIELYSFGAVKKRLRTIIRFFKKFDSYLPLHSSLPQCPKERKRWLICLMLCVNFFVFLNSNNWHILLSLIGTSSEVAEYQALSSY